MTCNMSFGHVLFQGTSCDLGSLWKPVCKGTISRISPLFNFRESSVDLEDSHNGANDDIP